jgi:ribosomal protein S12 methylthiotransferase
MPVVVDSPDPDVPGHVLCRSTADAPEIDAVVRAKGKNLRPGDFVKIKVVSADGYDLTGRAVGEVW